MFLSSGYQYNTYFEGKATKKYKRRFASFIFDHTVVYQQGISGQTRDLFTIKNLKNKQKNNNHISLLDPLLGSVGREVLVAGAERRVPRELVLVQRGDADLIGQQVLQAGSSLFYYNRLSRTNNPTYSSNILF